MINKVFLVGTVGALDERNSKVTESGIKYYKFGISLQEPKFTKDMNKMEYRTIWVTILAWNKLAEYCDEFLSAGLMVCAEGKLNPYSFKGDDGEQVKGFNVVASSIKRIPAPGKDKAENFDEIPF